MQNYFTGIENSVALAVDTGISDIIVTGDFNFDLLNERTAKKDRNNMYPVYIFQSVSQTKGKRVLGVPQSQTAALPRHQEE